jgi:hypothetical protein
LAVIVFELGDHHPDLSERFLLHHQVERHKDALQYQRSCRALGYPPFSDEQMAEIQRHRDGVVTRYGMTNRTTGAGQRWCCQASSPISGLWKRPLAWHISGHGSAWPATASTVAPQVQYTSGTSAAWRQHAGWPE